MRIYSVDSSSLSSLLLLWWITIFFFFLICLLFLWFLFFIFPLSPNKFSGYFYHLQFLLCIQNQVLLLPSKYSEGLFQIDSYFPVIFYPWLQKACYEIFSSLLRYPIIYRNEMNNGLNFCQFYILWSTLHLFLCLCQRQTHQIPIFFRYPRYWLLS